MDFAKLSPFCCASALKRLLYTQTLLRDYIFIIFRLIINPFFGEK